MDNQLRLEPEAGNVATKLGELRIGITPAPDSPTPSALTQPTTLAVPVAELPTPPFSPSIEEKNFILNTPTRTSRPRSLSLPDTSLPPSLLPAPLPRNPPQPATSFPLFPLLPAELRLKIWSSSFLPRTIELHNRRTHYADSERSSGVPQWQSQSRNPAALSVNAEARAAALEFYTVALPLCVPHFSFGGDARNGDRLLYLNPEEDMVVMLGDLNYSRLTHLLEWFRKQDAAYHNGRRSGSGAAGRGKGLRRMAMSVGPWAHAVGAATLKAFARTVFADVEEFVMFNYKAPIPPETWRGGRVVLQEACTEDEAYRQFFVFGRGKQFREGDGWVVVGKRPIKIADIQFLEGW
ncbi:hypothetical protein B0T16DRAFT_421284 [Cercophora newfieldiana]|uniref:2EXR domain-containing protein n=1 Tax=Cercophora newfieldiana TaxID=92897 RepID=A0AA40CHD3_9PEZI|nr:hypothetical protein B0T16DRAFT_421284 [Cercophora newfieldiana]